MSSPALFLFLTIWIGSVGRESGVGPLSSGESQREAKGDPFFFTMINPITERARSLRKAQTDAESKLWYYLRAKRFYDLKFKRQEPIGPYYVDFVCRTKKIIIELDGGHHAEEFQKEYDDVRTQYLESRDYKVIRFWNAEVFENPEGVLQTLHEEIFGVQKSFDTVTL
jgi:very-short-patch-repair endonuclease